MKKERADQLLVRYGWAENQEKAKRLIMAGLVYTEDEERILTPGEKWLMNEELYVKGNNRKYVSRGGLKLEKALHTFKINLHNKIVLDIGSSTGGFTDVCLQFGAHKVYALDVGTNQLAWTLRQNERVFPMEQTNFRYSKVEDFRGGQPEFVCIDVSFISLKKIVPNLTSILKGNGEVVALIKPQFEAKKEDVGEKGIVTDRFIHQAVLQDIITFIINDGFSLKGLTLSPITGGKGNIEFLVYLQLKKGQSIPVEESIEQTLKMTNHYT